MVFFRYVFILPRFEPVRPYIQFLYTLINYRPTGCKGIELENITADWSDAGGSHSNSQWLSAAAECENQDFEADGMSIYDIVDGFAEDHSVWAEAFLGAWQRMQELRQDPDDMKDGPANSWLGYYPLQEMGAATGDGNMLQFSSSHTRSFNQNILHFRYHG